MKKLYYLGAIIAGTMACHSLYAALDISNIENQNDNEIASQMLQNINQDVDSFRNFLASGSKYVCQEIEISEKIQTCYTRIDTFRKKYPRSNTVPLVQPIKNYLIEALPETCSNIFGNSVLSTAIDLTLIPNFLIEMEDVIKKLKEVLEFLEASESNMKKQCRRFPQISSALSKKRLSDIKFPHAHAKKRCFK